MISLPKTEYQRTLVSNVGIVDKTTNPYFKITRVPPVEENEPEFVMVKQKFSIYFSIPAMGDIYWRTRFLENENA